MSAYVIEKTAVEAKEAIVASEHMGCLVVCSVIRSLVNEICKGIPYDPVMGSKFVHQSHIYAAIWMAGRMQGIREERAKRRARNERL